MSFFVSPNLSLKTRIPQQKQAQRNVFPQPSETQTFTAFRKNFVRHCYSDVWKAEKYKALISKYKAHILKYMACIFCYKPCVFPGVPNETEFKESLNLRKALRVPRIVHIYRYMETSATIAGCGGHIDDYAYNHTPYSIVNNYFAPENNVSNRKDSVKEAARMSGH